MTDHVFHLSPSGSTLLWIVVPIVLFMLGFMLFFLSVVFYAQNSSVQIGDNSLKIKGGLYGRSIPFNELHLEGARIINMHRERDFQFKWRRNGIGLPDYRAGWFQLRDGQKVLAFVTQQKEVLYLPTENGYELMLSLEEPEQFLDALRQKASS